jgi:hypothetical protein
VFTPGEIPASQWLECPVTVRTTSGDRRRRRQAWSAPLMLVIAC